MLFKEKWGLRKVELEGGRPFCLWSCGPALHSSVLFSRRAGNACFAATNWASPTTNTMTEENWNSAGFKRESTWVLFSPARTDSEQAAGLWLTCSRALKTCSMVANSSHSCFIERWVRVKDRYWLAGRVSRQSLGVQSRMLSHALPHKSTIDQGICMKLTRTLLPPVAPNLTCKHDLLHCYAAYSPSPSHHRLNRKSETFPSSDAHQCNLLYLT